MREIKFRGKRVDNGEWVYGYLTHNKESGKSWIGEFAFKSYYHTQVFPETVGQYTGLKDKNGKEIYEGDILSDGYEVGIINFDCESASYRVEFNDNYEPQEIHQETMWATIKGNIHDNPELL